MNSDCLNKTAKKLDLTKPVQTRDGRAVRVLITDLKGARQPLLAAVLESEGKETVERFNQDGTYRLDGEECEHDLVNVPEKRTVWVNMYPSGPCSLYHSTKAAADREAGTQRLACVEVTFTEGQGLL